MAQKNLAALLLAATIALQPLRAAGQVPPIQPPPGVQASSSTTFANLTTSGNLTVGGQLLLSGTINGGVNPSHPNGGGYFVEWLTDGVGLVTGDCTTVPVDIDVSGTPTTGDGHVGFTYTDGAGHSTNITTTPTTGETNAQIASALSTAFKANATIATIFNGTCRDGISEIKVIANALTSGSTFYFNQFWPEQTTASTTPINSAHTTITVSQGDARLEVNPYISLGRNVVGRTPMSGDLLGNFLVVGEDSTTDALSTQYMDLFTRILDPTLGSQAGNVQLVEASGTGIAFQGASTNGCCAANGGALLFGAGNAPPTGGYMGTGTWNVSAGYYVGGSNALTSTGLALGGAAISASNPLAVLGTGTNTYASVTDSGGMGAYMQGVSGSSMARFGALTAGGVQIMVASAGTVAAAWDTAGNMTNTGKLTVNSTAASTSTTTGSGVFAGGIGVAGAITAGNSISATGSNGGFVFADRTTSGGSTWYHTGGNGALYENGYGGNILSWSGASGAFTFARSIQIGSPTGADPGAGSLNLAGDIYKNGVSITAAAVAGQKSLQATKTSNYSVQAADSNTSFDNTGATGTVVFTLPSYAAGLRYCFTVTAAQTLEVLAPASNHIAIGTANSASAGNIQAGAVYSTACIVATSVSNQWAATSTTGSWAVN